MVIRDYFTKQRECYNPSLIKSCIVCVAMTADHCLDTIKDYLIGMVESWNNDRINLHSGISSIVSSFGSKKDYKYLSLRCPSGLDSGVGTCASTSSLPRRSRPSKESPLATEPPSVPPRPMESLIGHGKLHKLSLQEPHPTSQSEGMHRNTTSSVLPLGEAEDRSATFPRIGDHKSTNCISNRESTSRVRRINQPSVIHGKRSYVTADPIQRRTSAPWKLASASGVQPRPVERKGSSAGYQVHHALHTGHSPILPNRSLSAEHGPIYPPPLPRRRISESVDSGAKTLMPRFSPILDDFDEDDEDFDEDAKYSIIGALDYISPRRHAETDHDVKIKCKGVEGRPNISKLQKKLCNRNSTLRKGRRPSLHKRSLNHSSDASSDDSDSKKNKSRPQRRTSSYHPPRRISKSAMTRRKTDGSFPIVDSPEEKDLTLKTVDDNALPDQEKVNLSISPAGDGDNEESEWNGSKHSEVRHDIIKVHSTLTRNVETTWSDYTIDVTSCEKVEITICNRK